MRSAFSLSIFIITVDKDRKLPGPGFQTKGGPHAVVMLLVIDSLPTGRLHSMRCVKPQLSQYIVWGFEFANHWRTPFRIGPARQGDILMALRNRLSRTVFIGLLLGITTSLAAAATANSPNDRQPTDPKSIKSDSNRRPGPSPSTTCFTAATWPRRRPGLPMANTSSSPRTSLVA